MALRPVSNVFKEASPTHGSPRAAPGARVVHMRFCAFPKGTPIVKVLTLGACLFFLFGGVLFWTLTDNHSPYRWARRFFSFHNTQKGSRYLRGFTNFSTANIPKWSTDHDWRRFTLNFGLSTAQVTPGCHLDLISTFSYFGSVWREVGLTVEWLNLYILGCSIFFF